MNKEFRVNEQILRGPRDVRVREARIVDESGQALGVMDVHDALAMAREKNLDLIEVAPQAQPPVCRIMDYGRYKYEIGKREREQHKKQRQQDIKGVKMRPATAEHDFQVRLRATQKFLGEGDKVRVIIQFRSRELSHPEIAVRLMDKFVDALGDTAVIEKPAAIEGRMMTMILSPKA